MGNAAAGAVGHDDVVEAAVKALKDGHHGYTPAQGILELREAVAKPGETPPSVAAISRSGTSPPP